MQKSDKIKTFILIILIIVFCIGSLIYTLHPELSYFRNSIYGTIIENIFIVGLLVYLSFSKRIDLPILGKITVLSFGILYILSIIIDLGKIEALFFFLYSVFNIGVSIYLYRKYEKEYKSIWIIGAFSYLMTAIFAMRVKYINGEFSPTFLIPAIVVGVLVFMPCLIYGLVQYTLNKDLEKVICIPLLGIFGGFALTWLTISSMNVYLDTSTPTYVEFVIIDKDIDTGARQITTYEFEVKNEDTEFTIGVSEKTYYEYEINDIITLSIYKGAFNEAYYIHG